MGVFGFTHINFLNLHIQSRTSKFTNLIVSSSCMPHLFKKYQVRNRELRKTPKTAVNFMKLPSVPLVANQEFLPGESEQRPRLGEEKKRAHQMWVRGSQKESQVLFCAATSPGLGLGSSLHVLLFVHPLVSGNRQASPAPVSYISYCFIIAYSFTDSGRL